jgi:CRISPR-associated protein Cas1
LNPLYLSGFGVSLNVDGARLIVKDGFLEPDSTQGTHEFQPRRMPYDSVVIDGQTGTISITAIKWLMRHDVPLFVLDYNGTLLSSTLPREPVNGPLKIAQIEAYKDQEKRFYIAKKLLEAKAQRTLDVMRWLDARYGRFSDVQANFDMESERLEQCQSLPRLLSIEGRIADIYWRHLQQVLPVKFGFMSRMHETHQMNASDPVNVLLNYGYAILESQCRKALNSVGLEPAIGFLHEARQTKSPLVYDLQEPNRWLVDTTVISCLESGCFGKKGFYRMDNYVLRLRPEAAGKLIDALRIKFNSSVRYRGKLYSCDTVIRLKAQELANYVLGRRTDLCFDEPRPALGRADSEAVRDLILSLTTAQARRQGIGKGTLHVLRKHAASENPFKVYTKVSTRLRYHPAWNQYRSG